MTTKPTIACDGHSCRELDETGQPIGELIPHTDNVPTPADQQTILGQWTADQHARRERNAKDAAAKQGKC